MKNLISRTAAVAALTAAALSAPALAQQAPTFEFRVERASLTDESDIRAAYIRLEAEAGRYCQALDLEDRSATARCRFDVVANVVEAAGHDGLADYHREQVRDDRMVAGGQ